MDGCVTPASMLSTSVHQTLAWQTSDPNVTGTLDYAKGFVHRVKIRPDVVPFQQKLRRLPFAVHDAVSQEVKTLEEAGIVERIDSSEWVSSIVVTHKKTGGIQPCVDLREPNKPIIIDSHPLPHIEEVFTELRGVRMFSTLDIQSASHQVPLHEESRDITASITHEGLSVFAVFLMVLLLLLVHSSE